MRPRAGTRFRREDAVALTPRQEEVLRLLERGYTNAEVAEALGISLDGAKFHVGEFISKLGVSTREEAVEAWRVRRRRPLPLVAVGALRWAGAAIVAVAVVSVAALLVVLAANEGDGPEAAGEPAVPSPSVPGSSPGAEAGMVTCPEREPLPTPTAQAFIDWFDFVQFEGVSYGGSLWGPSDQQVPPSALGQPYGRVAFKLMGSVHDPGYRAQDCDASFLDPGTVLYTLKGYEPYFRIATADGRVYESYRKEGIRTAGEIADLKGKVRAIEFRWLGDQAGNRPATISDPVTVERLVELFLAAEFDDTRPSSSDGRLQTVELAFLLRDGTAFERTYEPDIGRVWPGIWLPAEFNDAANAAMGRGR